MTNPGIISHLAFYPVKSCGGIEVPSALLAPSGLTVGEYRDHEFMVVNATPDASGIHHFISQRHKRGKQDKVQGLSVMALIKPQFVADQLYLTWNNSETDRIHLPYDQNVGDIKTVQMWDDQPSAVCQNDDISTWISDHLKHKVLLVKATGLFHRNARTNYLENTNPLLFQDAYPIHLFSEASLHELNIRAGYDFPWQRFRPQIVVSGMKANDEHEIFRGYINGVYFAFPKPCDRCTIPRVDYITGDVGENDPVAALSEYKIWINRDNKLVAILGENMLPFGTTKIKRGDTLHLTVYRHPPLVYGSHAEMQKN